MSIRSKLTILTLAIIAFMTVGASIVAIQVIRGELINSLAKRGASIGLSASIPAGFSILNEDRLALDNRSPYFNEAALDRGIGVRFKGVEYTNVAEYCVSEGWIRLPVGKSLDRRGNAMTFKHIGTVEVWYLT